jgi:transposase
MYITHSRNKTNPVYYINESYRNMKGRPSSRVVKRLGELEVIQKAAAQQGIALEEWLKEQVRNAEEESGAAGRTITIKLKEGRKYADGTQRSFNAGYLLLQKELYALGFKRMAAGIAARHKFRYDFESVLADMIYARVLEPCSKLGTYEWCGDSLLEQPKYERQHMYRALDVIASESDAIQAELYRNSTKRARRGASVLFYDCTNFYFEIESEDEFRRYGISKEHRPNPIVQMGLLVDGSGVPLALTTFPGNQNEQPSLKPLEKKILKDFGLEDTHLVICTDSGLASEANRRFNSVINRDYITVMSLKRMNAADRAWALDRGRSLRLRPVEPGENPDIARREIEFTGWRIDGRPGVYSLDDIDEDDPEMRDRVFYKERIHKAAGGRSERLIVTYSLKYRDYMRRKRASDIRRAQKLIDCSNGKKIVLHGSNDVRAYISTMQLDADGRQAEGVATRYVIDPGKVAESERLDGFYAVVTSVPASSMSVSEIVAVNHGRWQIEESFRIMKTEFDARPVYLHREERIKAHFTVCFMALLVFRMLLRRLNESLPEERRFTPHRLVKALRALNVGVVSSYFCGGFKNDADMQALQDLSGMVLNCELISGSTMKKYIRQSKKTA